MKIVIDTNIYISAIFWEGKPREVVDLGRYGQILIFTSPAIESEIAEKLSNKFKLKEDEVKNILMDFSTFTIPTVLSLHIEAVPEDPEDNKFIECAHTCKADYIVSGDEHLLSLKNYKGIQIINGDSFLKILDKVTK